MHALLNHRKRLISATTFITLFLTASVHAQETYYEEDILLLYQDEEMVSIATGTEKPLHLAPSVASVITSKDIKAMGAKTLDEALEFVPGLHVSRDPSRQSAIYSIRGIHTSFNPQVILLLNGHPINDTVTGSRPPLFKLPVANISRIEIIRGPGSAVYGADAFAGVINVITKDAKELNGTTAGVRAGSFDSHDVWLQHAGQLANWESAFSFEYSTTNGDDDRYIEQDFLGNSGSMNTQYELYNTSINLNNNNWNIWLNSWNLRDAGIGVGAAQALDSVGYQEADQYTVKLDYENKNLSKNWQVNTNFTYRKLYQQSYYQLYPAGETLRLDEDGNFNPIGIGYAKFTEGAHGNPGGKITHNSFETSFSYHGLNSHFIRIAFGIKYDETTSTESKNFGPGVIDGTTLSTDPNNPTIIPGPLTSVTGTANIFLPDSSRTVHYLSVQDEWKFARDWELTGGIRYDHYSDFGNTINPRLALVWATKYNLTSKLLYGRAFRAPSYGELYYINNPTALGNPDLNPETIDMVELVFDYRPTFDLETILNLFRYQARDLIGLDDNFTAQNLHNQHGYGIELDVEFKATNKLTLLGNMAWQRSKDRDTSEPISDAPGHQVSLALRLRTTDRCFFNTQINWVADRQRTLEDTRSQVDDHTTLDLITRCHNIFGKPLEIAASVKNALNEGIREPSSIATPHDYPQEGRSVYIELSYNFNQ